MCDDGAVVLNVEIDGQSSIGIASEISECCILTIEKYYMGFIG